MALAHFSAHCKSSRMRECIRTQLHTTHNLPAFIYSLGNRACRTVSAKLSIYSRGIFRQGHHWKFIIELYNIIAKIKNIKNVKANTVQNLYFWSNTVQQWHHVSEQWLFCRLLSSLGSHWALNHGMNVRGLMVKCRWQAVLPHHCDCSINAISSSQQVHRLAWMVNLVV